MKPMYGVIFSPNVPLDLTLFGGQRFEFGQGDALIKTMVLTCSEVNETSFGLLHLVPKELEGQDNMTLFVPPAYILWMVRADKESKLGFLSN